MVISFIKTHFPNNKEKFIIYFKLFYPMIIGSTLYALNGFVDNFMVGQIEQGGTALSAVNSWTNIILGLFIGISASGSVMNAKYYFSKNFEKSRNLFKFRLQLGILIGFIFALVSWVAPDVLIKVFLKEPKTKDFDYFSYLKALECSREYIRIISLSWIMLAITSQLGSSLREIGYGKVSMYWGLLTLLNNIVLNAVLMYGFGMGVVGAAIASDVSRVFAICFGFTWMIVKKITINFNFLYFWKNNLNVIKDFFSKWYLFFAFSFVMFFITLRYFFYDAAYKAGSNTLGIGVSAMSVLALTSAFLNVFTTTFAAAGAMAANVVGKELAKNNEKEAFKNAKELKGFMTFVSCVLSLILFIIALFIPYMDFLSVAQYDSHHHLTFDNKANLIHVRNSLIVVCFFYPIWIWFTTSYRSGSVGKKGFWFAFVDFFVSGPVQLIWISIIAYCLVPHFSFLQSHFWLTLFIFYVSDIFKLLFQELLFYKYPWCQKISQIEYIEHKAELEDEIEASPIDMH